MTERYEQLDSLRGLAALSVVLSHLSLVIPNFILTSRFNNTPLHIFWAGHEAVILFFLLSGFVLSLPFLSNNNISYQSYLIRRICRIYIPYIVSIFIGVILVDKVSRHGISGLTEWFNSFWLNPIDFKTIVNHIIFLGDYKNDSINFVIWSLIHEMRISIIFPFIFLLVKKTNWKLTIGLCFTLSIVYYFGEIALNKIDYNDRYFSSYERTIHYVGIFMFGSLLAKNRLLLINFCKRQNILVKIIFLIFAIMCYTYSWWFLPAVGIIHLEIFNDWVIAFGSSIFISLCLSLKTLQKILLLKPIHFLGNISYSLYLLHGIVLLATINILYGVISYWKILVLSFVISILSATLSYYFVEHPSIKLGRKLTNKNQLITSGNKNEASA